MRLHRLLPLSALVALAACGSDDPASVSLSPADACVTASALLATDSGTAAARWGRMTREVNGRREFAPPAAARTFALVGVAQHNAAVAARGRGTAAVAGAAAGAAAAVLAALHPAESSSVAARLAADAALVGAGGTSCTDAFTAGVSLGRDAAVPVLTRAGADGARTAWTGTVPVGPGLWVATTPPLAPQFATVRPWALTSAREVRPAAPPAFGTDAFAAALAEVKATALARTPAQIDRIRYWAGIGTPSGPLGIWSIVAWTEAARARLDEARAAHLAALWGAAGMDAGIACWDAKFAYWTIRPQQADPSIPLTVPTPSFPAFPSAHSCFSAAYAGILAQFFPDRVPMLDELIDESGTTRVAGGLHYWWDVTAGRTLGHAVAERVLQRFPTPGVAIRVD